MNDNDNIIPFKGRDPEPPKEKPSYPPMFNIPPFTKGLLVSLVFIHTSIFTLDLFLPHVMDVVVGYGALIPASWMGEVPFTWATPFTPILYTLLHGSWLHLAVNALMLAAAGSGTERWLGGKQMLVIFFCSSVMAALTHFAVAPYSDMPVVGASGGISGLFATVLYKMYLMGQLGVGRGGLWRIVLIWVGISAVFGYMGSPDGMPIAWVAHIGGFLGGLGLAIHMTKRPKH